MAGLDPGGSFSDLHGGVGGEEDLVWTLPTVGAPMFPPVVLDEDEVAGLQVVQRFLGWSWKGLFHLSSDTCELG